MSADDQHLSIDQLADLGADLASPAEAAAAQAHLVTCADCRDTAELLAGVPDLLAGVAAVPIPAHVNIRVVAAIEREQLARADQPSAAQATAPARSVRAGLGRRIGLRLGAGLLGATTVLGGGYLVLANTGLGSGADEDSGATSAESLRAEDAPGDAGGTADQPEEAGSPAATSALNYRAATLDADVIALVAGFDLQVSREPAVEGEDGQIGEPDDIRTKACVAATQRKAGTEADPLAVDISEYEGRSAVIVVLPQGTAGSDPAPWDVWVVGDSCVDLDLAQYSVPQITSDLEVLEHTAVQPPE